MVIGYRNESGAGSIRADDRRRSDDIDAISQSQLNGWEFITVGEFTMPTNEQLKNAIYTYGPVTAGVCTDADWPDYSGGVYVTPSNTCEGSTDHQIILVGWDDSTESWILRNSWGATWGENGYMRIKYDPDGLTSRAGEGTSWVTYTKPPRPSLAGVAFGELRVI